MEIPRWEQRPPSQVQAESGPHATERPALGAKKSKRSTQRGDAQAKLIATLTKHHQYADGGCLNTEPVGSNELAREAKVSPSTASAFFEKHFKGYSKYRLVCKDPSRLVDSLKVLRGEFSPHDLYGRTPPGEGHREEG
jgi:hypothetical protein